jgi:bifunctional non-homologous end joining protein LigD
MKKKLSKIPPLNTLPGARKAKLAQFIQPQLATLVKEPPSGDQWLHELKFDGYRMLCRLDGGRVQFWSRNARDWTDKFLSIVDAIKLLPAKSAFIDGEIVIVDAQGRSSFQKLQRSMGKSVSSGFIYAVFDLIYLDGFDLRQTPLRLRKDLLENLCKASGHRLLRYSEHFEGNGDTFFRHACEYGIEGILSKLANSPYESTRNRNWVKVKCNIQQEFVIVGYTPSSKGLPGFGSLVLGVYDKGKLVYAGRVGTGFTFKQRTELQKQLDKFSSDRSHLAAIPRDPGLKQTRWTEPKLVAEVAFTEWTSDNSIRHPSFQGLREDKNPKEVVREVPIETSDKRRRKR